MFKAANLPPMVKLSRLVAILLKVFFVLEVFLVVFSDVMMPSMIETSDYAATFYVPGKLIASGRLSELYPSPQDTRLADTAYNKAAHSILPNLPAVVGTAYSYPPWVALMISPLTFLPPALSLLAFQILSLGALAVSAFLLSGCDIAEGERRFLAAFLFTPVAIVLWIGQLDVVAGVLPYACMYHLLRKNKSFNAGLVASLAIMKPQLAIAPVFVAIVLLSKRKWKMFAGLAVGISLLSLLTVMVWGVDVCKAWIVAVKLQESDFLSPTSGVPRHLAVSIPRLLLFMVPLAQVNLFRPFVYGFAACIVFAAISVCRKLHQNDPAVLNVTVVVACLMLPMVAPHLFYYDLSILVVAGYLAFAQGLSDTTWSTYIRPRILVLWIVISIYPFIFVLNRSMYLPLMILTPVALVFADMLKHIWQHSRLLPEQKY